MLLAATGGVAIGKGVLEDTGNNLAGGVAIGQDSASTGAYSLAMGTTCFLLVVPLLWLWAMRQVPTVTLPLLWAEM